LQAKIPVKNLEDDIVVSGNVQLPSDPLSLAEWYITKLYQTRDVSLIPKIIELYNQAHQYEKALGFLQLLQEKGILTDKVPIEVIMTTLLNGIELNFQNIDTLKTLVQKYYDQKLLTPDQFAMYDALITFTRGDHNNYSYFMDQIKDGKYLDWKTSFAKLKQQFLSFPDAPTSYLDALVAMDIFKRGYIGVAITTAKRLYAADPSYLLPRQILAYGAMFLGRWDEALLHLDFLIEKDPENKQIYLFFKGVAFFQTGKYQESLLVFQQISLPELKEDILKYQILIYTKLKDRTKLQEVVEQIS
jgi:tetratricopeptide (TPR) repeat protein